VSILAALAVSGCSAFFPSGGDKGSSSQPAALTGCAATPTQPVAPGGYYVNGNTVCTADGRAHLFHGVDRPSLEWSPLGEHLSASDFALMGNWKANVVRVALNQDYWLPGSSQTDTTYPGRVDSAIAWAEAAGMDVILDLHWSDKGVLGSCPKSCQQMMADANSLTFWTQVADRYKGDGRVLFELYNEPFGVSWPVWQSGGSTGTWQAVGMQQLYEAVRATGAENLVVIGGLEYAYDLSGVPASRISGHNIMYATHPYNDAPDKAAGAPWDTHWGFLTATDPVIVTEFGDRGASCPSQYSSELIAYADQHHASWTAWAWYVGGCTFPSIIAGWDGTPNAPGMAVQAALAGYDDPAASGATGATSATDAGSGATDAGGGPDDAATGGDDAGAPSGT
jgi:hypothetical protein